MVITSSISTNLVFVKSVRYCVRLSSLCSPLWHRAELLNGLTVPSTILSSQLGEMRDCLMH